MEKKTDLQVQKTPNQWAVVIQETGRIPSELMPKSEDMSVRCLAKWPNQYYKSLKPKNFDDVIDSPVCYLETFKKTAGEEKAMSVLVLILNDVIDFFNVSNSMSPDQVLVTAEMILDYYGCLKIDDFKLCFSLAKRGLFGQVYRIDGNVILSWLKSYFNDRLNFADERSYNEHCSRKERNEKKYDKVLDGIYSKLKVK